MHNCLHNKVNIKIVIIHKMRKIIHYLLAIRVFLVYSNQALFKWIVMCSGVMFDSLANHLNLFTGDRYEK